MRLSILEIIYLIASISFILGLKMLSNPKTARKGNLIAAVGMGLAIFATIFLYESKEGEKLGNFLWIAGGLLVGTVLGWMMAMKVKMTAMPQMVSIFNGMGGACAAVISLIEFNKYSAHHTVSGYDGELIIMLLGLAIGAISFSGSMIAFGKLEGKIKDRGSRVQQFVNLLLMLLIIAVTIGLSMGMIDTGIGLYGLLVISLIYGILFVMPIGGADMPVVISLLNSFTGLAAAFAGFLYGNQAMLTGGILVGSAGTILTILMCKAMNRSLVNVIIGAFSGSSGAGGESEDGTIQEASASDTAILCNYATNIFIVPGYGLAVAQAQHTCHEFEKILQAKGVNVRYAIHPVAGRMPGHMNVLMAEADVAYEKLVEMEDANPSMSNTDVVLVIGANDVVNPAAEDDPSSPIYGMPILKVSQAKNVIILKRSMNAGYAGIQNKLFFNDKTRMLFGDARDSLEKLITEIKNL